MFGFESSLFGLLLYPWHLEQHLVEQAASNSLLREGTSESAGGSRCHGWPGTALSNRVAMSHVRPPKLKSH